MKYLIPSIWLYFVPFFHHKHVFLLLPAKVSVSRDLLPQQVALSKIEIINLNDQKKPISILIIIIIYTYLTINRHNVLHLFSPLASLISKSLKCCNFSSGVLLSLKFSLMTTDSRSFSINFIHVKLGLPLFLLPGSSDPYRASLTRVCLSSLIK